MLSPVVMKLLVEARMNELNHEAQRERQARKARPWSTFPIAALGVLLAAFGLIGRIA